MSDKLPAPHGITHEELRKVFEKHGFSFVPRKELSLDILDLLVPLVTIVQWTQWWGKLCEVNDPNTSYALDVGYRAITTHAAGPGQQIGVVPVSTLHDALKMASVWLANLTKYGRDLQVRAERIHDQGVTQISNELLDSVAPMIMEVLALTLPPNTQASGDKPPSGN